MAGAVLAAKRRWLLAGFGAVVMVVGFLWLVRLPEPPVTLRPPAAAESPKVAVNLARPDDSNRLLNEESELRDMRPLFLPTERNAALPEPRLESGQTFLDNETLKLTFTDEEGQVSRDLPPIALLDGKRVEEAKITDALSPTENAVVLQGFGRGPAKVKAVPVRSAFLQVASLSDGSHVLQEKLPADARPPLDKAWEPVEFIATVDSAGLVGPLVVVEGSREEETDSYFRNYLAQSFRIGDRLAPGFYRITVSP